jgi:uncharacterized protein (DUF1499 family)
VGNINGGKLMSPKDLDSLTTTQEQIHISVSSDLFGFLDDFYMTTMPYKGSDQQEMRLLNFQSQLRIGSYDFDQNYQHIKDMLDCLNEAYNTYSNPEMPCSV